MNAKVFWFISLVLLSLSIAASFILQKFFSLGLLGTILVYASAIAFIGFLFRQKWGFFATFFIQLIFLGTYIFPQMQPIEAILQFIGLGIIYLSKDFFPR